MKSVFILLYKDSIKSSLSLIIIWKDLHKNKLMKDLIHEILGYDWIKKLKTIFKKPFNT